MTKLTNEVILHTVSSFVQVAACRTHMENEKTCVCVGCIPDDVPRHVRIRFNLHTYETLIYFVCSYSMFLVFIVCVGTEYSVVLMLFLKLFICLGVFLV